MEQWCHTCKCLWLNCPTYTYFNTYIVHTLYMYKQNFLDIRKNDTKANTACQMVGTVSRWYSCDTIFCCDRDHLHSKEHAQLGLCWLISVFFLFCIIMQNTMHNFAEAKTSHSIKMEPMISFFNVCVHSLVCFLIKKLY